MKRMVLALLAVLLSSLSFAQFNTATRCLDLPTAKGVNTVPIWKQIVSPFIANDINGNTVNLQSYLSSGKFVVVDYSCTWCSPCWNLHNSGVLEALNALDDVQVIFVESETSNSTAQLYGPAGGSTYSDMTLGNWTVDANGASVGYPIIDDDVSRTCLFTCGELYGNAVPYVVLIAPNGYYCSIFGEDYGIDSWTPSSAVDHIQTLMNSYPRSGMKPLVDITGNDRAYVGTAATFTAQYVSVDSVTSVVWAFQNATPATDTGETASCIWSAPGTYTVTLTVTNIDGYTSQTMSVEVCQMGETLGYVDSTSEWAHGYTLQDGTTWAVSFDASLMTGRRYLKKVDLYVINAGPFSLKVYQGGDNAPESLIYSRDVTLGGSGWQTINVSGPVALDQTKSLWIVMSSTAVYPMSVTNYTGDVNSDWVLYQNHWYHFNDMGYPFSMMLTATTADQGNAGISTLSNAEVALYPNPTTGILNVTAEGVREIIVYDVDGRAVMSNRNANTINVADLANGVYTVRVITNNGVATQKIVKK